MKALCITLFLLATGVSAVQAAPTDQAEAQDTTTAVTGQEGHEPVFTPIDVQAVSSELDAKLELTLEHKALEKSEWQPMLVSVD
mgnify:CR=1 FL=1